MAQTDYVVLRQSPDAERDGRLWRTEPRIYKATSASKAVRLAAEAAVGDPAASSAGTFVAVPLRSWSPIELGWENLRRIVVRKSDLTDPKIEVPAAA